MIKKLVTLGAVLTLSACASQPVTKWVSLSQVDDFTDEKTCKVTWAIEGNGIMARRVFAVYPVVLLSDQARVKVGLESVSMNRLVKVDIPVGDVQLRVDGLPTHTVSSIDSEEMAELVSEGDQVAMMKAQTNAILSPMTLAQDDEAERILDEMQIGKVLRYRQVVPGSSGETGEFSLEGFDAAYLACQSEMSNP